MRMWNVPTKMMCRQHLLGEHLETHMFHSSILQGRKITGFITNGLVETDKIKERHDALVEEMISRGYNHKTPMEENNFPQQGRVDISKNINILINKCVNCKERHIRLVQ